MTHQIIRQPDGLLAVFSPGVDDWVIADATPEELFLGIPQSVQLRDGVLSFLEDTGQHD
jgi:hypothetical protein